MRNEHLADRDWLLARYVDRWEPVSEIARDAGAHVSTVYLWLRRHGIPSRRRVQQVTDRVIQGHLDRGRSITEIARRLQVDRAVIYDRMYRSGLRSPDVSADPEDLRRWYEDEGWSTRRIASELGLDRRTVARQLRAAGVRLRPAGRMSISRRRDG